MSVEKLHTESMNTKFTITLALVAGFIGGLASRYSAPASVHAQAPAVPQEIRAHKFVLVDETGVARGVFGIETNGTAEIEISDSKGRVLAPLFDPWMHPSSGISGAINGPKKPTLLPIKP